MGTPVQRVVVEDNDLEYVDYYPQDAWEALAGAHRHGNSYHGTYAANAYVTFQFDGTYVAYYSDKNVGHGDFLAHIDGKPALRGDAYSPHSISPSILLFNASVDPGPHILTLTNSVNGTWIGVDYFLCVRPTVLPCAAAYCPISYHPRKLASTSALSAASSDSHATHATGVISPAGGRASVARFNLTMGLICGLLVPMCCIAPSIIVLLLRYRRRSRCLEASAASIRPFTVTVPGLQPPPYRRETLAEEPALPEPRKSDRAAQLSWLFGSSWNNEGGR